MSRKLLEQFQDCAQRGLTVPETARRLEVSRNMIYRAASRNGIRFRSARANVDVAALRECADNGMSRVQAAKKLGVTYKALYAAARRHGIEFPRGRKGPVVPRGRYRECAERGMTVNEAANALGVAPSSVRHAAQRDGLQFAGMALPWPKPSRGANT